MQNSGKISHRVRPRSSVDQTELQNPSENQRIFEHGGHVVDTTRSLSGANWQMADADPLLDTVIAAWTKLPGSIKAGIVAMIKAAT